MVCARASSAPPRSRVWSWPYGAPDRRRRLQFCNGDPNPVCPIPAAANPLWLGHARLLCTLACIGRNSHHITPAQPYNPHSIAATPRRPRTGDPEVAQPIHAGRPTDTLVIATSWTSSGPLILCLLSSSLASAQDTSPGPIHFRVSLEPTLGSSPVSGRLLVYLTASVKPVDIIEPGFGAETKDVWIVAKEVQQLAPGDSVVLSAEDLSLPAAALTCSGGRLSSHGAARCRPQCRVHAYDRA